MEHLRCACGKILCQVDEQKIIIKCRHCKRHLVITIKGIDKVTESKNAKIAI